MFLHCELTIGGDSLGPLFPTPRSDTKARPGVELAVLGNAVTLSASCSPLTNEDHSHG